MSTDELFNADELPVEGLDVNTILHVDEACWNNLEDKDENSRSTHTNTRM